MTKERKLRAYVDIPTYVGPAVTHALTITNISLSGCFLRTNTWLDIGTSISLRVTLPGGKMLPIEGRIVRRHTGPEGYGISFEAMSEAERKELALLIAN